LVLEATVNLIDSPPERSLVVIGFPDIFVAADRVPEILQFGPIALEGVDDRLVDDVRRKGMHADGLKLLPAGKGWLLIEFGGQTKAEAEQKANRLVEHFRGHGCVHTRNYFDLQSAEGIRTFRSFLDEASDLVLSYGGSLSGEHGDGQSRADLLPKMFGDELMEAFREFKSIWDPEWKMNPGKVVDAYRITENLRLGTDYRPPQVDAHFSYPDDGGSLAHATTRCVR